MRVHVERLLDVDGLRAHIPVRLKRDVVETQAAVTEGSAKNEKVPKRDEDVDEAHTRRAVELSTRGFADGSIRRVQQLCESVRQLVTIVPYPQRAALALERRKNRGAHVRARLGRIRVTARERVVDALEPEIVMGGLDTTDFALVVAAANDRSLYEAVRVDENPRVTGRTLHVGVERGKVAAAADLAEAVEQGHEPTALARIH